MQYHLFEQGNDLALLTGSPLKEVARFPKGDFNWIAEAFNEWAAATHSAEPVEEAKEEPEPDFFERTVAAAHAADAVRKSDGRKPFTRHMQGARELPFPKDRQDLAIQRARVRGFAAKYLAPIAGVSDGFARNFLAGRACTIDYGIAMEKAIDQAAAL